MTVLVTGGAGYIGGHMALALLDAGESVVVLDDLSTGFAWAVPPAAKLIVGDFGDAALVDSLIKEHGVDAIAHFAAKIVVPESVADPLAYYLNNTAKARNLLECAVRNGIAAFHLLLDGGGLWRARRQSGVRNGRAGADQSLRALQDDGRMDARGRRRRASAALRRAALFQCRRRRSGGTARPVLAGGDASHQGRGASGARPARRPRRFRNRLSDAGRILHPRLHPGDRSRRRASSGAAPSARRRRKPHPELRLWPRLFRARSRRCGEASLGGRFRGAPQGSARRAIRPRSSPAPRASGPNSAGRQSTTISTKSCARRSTGSAACITARGERADWIFQRPPSSQAREHRNVPAGSANIRMRAKQPAQRSHRELFC